MRARVLAAAALVAIACAAPSVQAEPSPVPPAEVRTATPEPTVAPAPTASAPPSPTPEPPPRVTRDIAGIEFSVVAGTADLRVETSVSRADESAIAATVASDVPAVEREFGRSFSRRPVIYVFASNEGYAEGFERIFGYPHATAAFVAENSVSFFEPSLRIISVNWVAVRDRPPVTAIRHELTHLLTLDACAPRCDLVPAWLNEGQARLAEALVPGGEWRLTRVRYEAASMAQTGTLIPLSALVSQLAWNGLTEWAGYFKYQEAARTVELLRADVGGDAPVARLYERVRRGQNVAQAYAGLTGRSFEDFVLGLPARMREGVPAGPALVPVALQEASASYLLYGFMPSASVWLTVSGPRGSEGWPLTISPFGSNFDAIPLTRARGVYTVNIQDGDRLFTLKLRKTEAASAPGDIR